MQVRSFLLPVLALLLGGTLCGCSGPKDPMKPITPVDFSCVTIDDSFWSPWLQVHKDVTLGVCIDQIENQTGRIRNFESAAAHAGEHEGIFYDDSDVYKALEGMAYSLVNNPDPALEAKCDEWIAKFAAAQEEDGYINTYYTVTGLERWSDMDKHEMYCAGHLIEAGVAYQQATGKTTLLEVGRKMADYMMTVFGPGKRDWVPGHEEIELALVKLYGATGEKKYLDFAEWLLNERGHGYFMRPEGERIRPLKYCQDDLPVKEMRSVGGHAVRAMYLYCGMADVAALTGDAGYMEALDSLWDDVCLRNMYVTGGIGQTRSNEGFTSDWDLPNETAYCETCASIGMVLWNWRMNQFKGDGKYADVMERVLYNAALAGISLSGDQFFYVNPLESAGEHHRKPWYRTACCPSNLNRFIPSIGNYIYGVSDDAVWVNLYIGGKASFQAGSEEITLTQETSYPWTGDVRLTVSAKKPVKKDLRLRIPSWCTDWTLSVNGKALKADVEKGYAVIPGKLSDGDVITLHMDMPVFLEAADPRVIQDRGKRTVRRGPIVYCMEEVDNPDSYDGAKIGPETAFTLTSGASVPGGGVAIQADGLTFIPYYAWDNRAPGRMKVWIDWSGEDSLAKKPLRIAVAGVTHDHLGGVVSQLGSGELEVVGVWEGDSRYLHQNALTGRIPEDRFYASLEQMLDETAPEAVVAYGSIKEHLAVVEACAPRGIHVMVEKPLATTLGDARRMEELARKNGILLLTNYETTWYASNHQVKKVVEAGTLGPVYRIEVYDGHEGPIEIGCSKKFTDWLTDPILNGGGAVTDFGCYGANLATWLLDGQKPQSVYAVLQHNKPDVYPKVDDDATIVLRYPGTTVEINASWCWPTGRKDMYVYGKEGALYQANPLLVNGEEAPALDPPYDNPFHYLSAAVRGEITVGPADLSALENNLTVVEILEAAIRSDKTGKAVTLSR